jgi:hypothetical protein
MKIKIFSLLATYLIFNQINFQEVFAQRTDGTYKPFEDFYSIVGTAFIPLAVTTLDNNNGPIYNFFDDFIIALSIISCPFLNLIENFDELPILANFIVMGFIAILYIFLIIFHNIDNTENTNNTNNTDNTQRTFSKNIIAYFRRNKNFINTSTVLSIIVFTETEYIFIPVRYGTSNIGHFATPSQRCDDKFGHSACMYTYISAMTILFVAFFVYLLLPLLVKWSPIKKVVTVKNIRNISGRLLFLLLFVTVANNFTISALLLSKSFYVTQGAASLGLVSLARLLVMRFKDEETQKKSLISSVINYEDNNKLTNTPVP